MGSIKVEFSISTNIDAETEGQAWHVLHQIVDYLQDNVTIDCKLGSEYELNHKGKIKQLEELVNQLVAEVEELKASK